MEQDTFAVGKVEVGAGRRFARRLLGQQDISHALIEEVVANYTAASRSGMREVHALEVATGLEYPTGDSCVVRAESLDDFLEQVAHSPGREEAMVGGLHESLLEHMPAPPRTVIGGRVYQRRSARSPEQVTLIGVDEQRALLDDQLRRLFLYNPLTGRNHRARAPGIVFYGPPGTGKSSLCRYALAESKRLSKLSKLPFCYETFQSSDHSKWVGESAKIVKQKFARASDPSGVGIMIFDDIDMIISSRDDSYASKGELQVTNQIMQELDGVDASAYHNTLVLATTNRPQDLDGALDRRLPVRVEVPPYQHFSEHREFMDAFAGWADAAVRDRLAEYTFERGLVASRMRDVVSHVDRVRHGPVTEQILALALERRLPAYEQAARDLSVPDVESVLADYDPCCSYRSST